MTLCGGTIMDRKTMKRSSFTATLALLLAIQLHPNLATAQTNLLVNGSFERSGGWQYYVMEPTYSYIGGDSNAFGGTTVPDGNYFLCFYQGQGEITQYFNVIDGATYMLSFSAINFDGASRWQVIFGGIGEPYRTNDLSFSSLVPVSQTVQQSIDDPGLYNHTWENFTFYFQGDVYRYNSIRFNFQEQFVTVEGTSYFGSGGLDNVRVIQVVPEPGTVALLAVGALTGLARRRHSHQRIGDHPLRRVG